MTVETVEPKDCKDGGYLYPSGKLYRRSMTDKEIGKTAREIADKGYTAMVKKNKDGYLILRQQCEIVRKDNVSADKKL